MEIGDWRFSQRRNHKKTKDSFVGYLHNGAGYIYVYGFTHASSLYLWILNCTVYTCNLYGTIRCYKKKQR